MIDTRCNCCGGPLDWPPLDFGADAPWRQCGVDEDEFGSRVRLTRDVCIIDNKAFMIRANVQIPIIDHDAPFAWGVWSSLSQKSFERVQELWDSPEQIKEPPFFSWLLTSLPCYDEPTAPIKSRLHLRGPCVVPYLEVTTEHALGREQVEGITMERVWRIARHILGDSPPTCPKCV